MMKAKLTERGEPVCQVCLQDRRKIKFVCRLEGECSTIIFHRGLRASFIKSNEQMCDHEDNPSFLM